MQTIRLETRIAAPALRCFLLSLNIDLVMNTTARTRERAIAGVTHGLIGAGESVTWEGRHFGLRVRHTSKIVSYEPPSFFCDEMTAGIFRSFRHEHHFAESDGETVMRDVLEFAAPLGLLGRLAEWLVLRNYMHDFLVERNAMIKQVAESDRWRRYLQ
ncbi:SRPBCC family protein [Edaphobacter bradus]|uniref:SRPBCC family protein n=1 Tax=Edaphobacter bradus TaxID=2259016 RepID=UPI0021E075CF|nr:SRPBCC family protein [Edaphobacter bradus]